VVDLDICLKFELGQMLETLGRMLKLSATRYKCLCLKKSAGC